MPEPSIRVLLVDDDENAFLLIRHLLTKISGKKFDVEWAPTYQAGLERIGSQQHDIYLLDYRLGAQNGLDLLRKAISLGALTPVIILTAAADPKVDLEATRIGAADFLLKDQLDSSTLERSIRFSIQHFATLRALQKSHERFRLLFERSMDAILISDDDGRFLEVNGAGSKLLGHTREELLEMRVSDLLSTETGPAAERLRDQAFGELTFVQRDGDRRYAEFSACRFAPNLNLSILRDITDRRNLEKEIQEISEKEQRRLGQDLHDGLGQALTGISFLAKVLQQKLAAKKREEAVDAANIVSLLNQTLTQARELARGLCPTVLETNDITAALDQLASNLGTFFGVSPEVEYDSGVQISDNAVAIHLYRIAQEACTNAIKHGKSGRIWISLNRKGTQMILKIRDNGCGFPKGQKKSKGMGLRVMQHRARMIGATLEVEPGADNGTVVTCILDQTLTAQKTGASPSSLVNAR